MPNPRASARVCQSGILGFLLVTQLFAHEAVGAKGNPSKGALGPAKAEEPSGFRMSSDPKIITVFGDAAQFRAYVDDFFSVHARMQETREAFSQAVQNIVATLAAHASVAKGRTRCPVDALALSYARAFHRGQLYHRLGKELEAHHASILALDELGETAGLTPDYRWKVARSLKLYPEVLRDFREMRVSFQQQLASELSFAGCDASQLVTKGDELEKSGAAPPPLPVAQLPTTGRPKKEPNLPPVTATTVTFFVDNGTCETSVRVYVDGLLVGEVGGHAKAAFRSASGRHDMCLLSSNAAVSCGDTGTLRKTYIHDGWSIALRCD